MRCLPAKGLRPGSNILTIIFLTFLLSFLLSKGTITIVAQSPEKTAATPALGLGRVTVWKLNVRSEPSPEALVVGQLQRDDVVEILVEKGGWYQIGENNWISSALVQPVRDEPASADEVVWELGANDFYGVITVPFIDVYSQPNANSSYQYGYRFYYSSVHRVINVLVDNSNQTWYQIWDDRYPKRTQFIPTTALKKLPDDLLTPLYPEVAPEHKLVDVNLTTKILQLKIFDANTQIWQVVDELVFSSGGVYLVDGKWVSFKTAPGTYHVLYKRLSRHMEGGSGTSYYNLPGVAFNTYFTWQGTALHATFWHNDWGTERSHGCINLRPKDALTVFRFTTPSVALKDFLTPTALATIFTRNTNQTGTKVWIHY